MFQPKFWSIFLGCIILKKNFYTLPLYMYAYSQSNAILYIVRSLVWNMHSTFRNISKDLLMFLVTSDHVGKTVDLSLLYKFLYIQLTWYWRGILWYLDEGSSFLRLTFYIQVCPNQTNGNVDIHTINM